MLLKLVIGRPLWYPLHVKASPIPVVSLLLLLGIHCPSNAAEQLVGGYSETSVTNTEVIAAAHTRLEQLVQAHRFALLKPGEGSTLVCTCESTNIVWYTETNNLYSALLEQIRKQNK